MALPRSLPSSQPDPGLAAFFDSSGSIPRAIRQSAAFFEFFAREVFSMLEACRPRLARLYDSALGRPAWDPVRLLAVTLLQFVTRLPDRQAAEAVQYDLRWRLALHLPLDQSSFDPSLLVVFRGRLLEHGEQRLAFQTVLDHLVDHGWVPKRSRQRLDSTHVWGLLQEISRLECVRETLGLFLRELDGFGRLPESWSGLWDRYVEEKIDPRAGVDSLKASFRQAGCDMLALWKESVRSRGISALDSFLLLQRVFLENFQMAVQGSLQVHRSQPSGAVHNPHEPEAQWSSKDTTKDKEWIGYKVQIAETCQEQPRVRGEPTANFLTAIVTQDAIASDKPGMTEVLAEQKALGLEPPADLYVDGAYVSGPNLHAAREEGRELHGPAPASPDRGKVFTVEAFDVHVEERYATCPAGHRSGNCSRLEEKQTGKVNYRIEWSQGLCDACPQHSLCVNSGQPHRTILVSVHHSLLQARRRQMATEAYQLDMRRRNGIEGTQSELVRGYGLRHARYRGKTKVRLQNYLIGAACNLRRLFRRLAWQAAQALKTPHTLPRIATN
jgi:transposase